MSKVVALKAPSLVSNDTADYRCVEPSDLFLSPHLVSASNPLGLSQQHSLSGVPVACCEWRV